MKSLQNLVTSVNNFNLVHDSGCWEFVLGLSGQFFSFLLDSIMHMQSAASQAGSSALGGWLAVGSGNGGNLGMCF